MSVRAMQSNNSRLLLDYDDIVHEKLAELLYTTIYISELAFW